MKHINLIIAALFAFAFVACNNTDKNIPLKVAATTDSIKYQCPMKDQHDTTYTTTGECPKCGMELEKIKNN